MAIRNRSVLLAFLTGGMVAAAGALLPSTPAAGATSPLTIGVDHAPPAGHNFEYVDYFPRSGVKVHTGDVVSFQWSATPDGFHTVTLLKSGQTPQNAWQSTPLAVPDSDDGSGALQFNPAIAGPTTRGLPGLTRRPRKPLAPGSMKPMTGFSAAPSLNSAAIRR